AYRIDNAVRARAEGELAQSFYGIFPAEVDGFCAMAARLVEAGCNLIDREDAARTEMLRACDGHHADGTTAEDRDCVAGMDVGHLRRLVRGGQDVTHHDGLIVGDLLG